MRKTTLITGLDVGSAKVAAVAAELDARGILRIIACCHQPSKGTLKGYIGNLNDTVESVSKVLAALKNKIPQRLDDIYVNTSGETVKGERSRGMIPLSLRGREVTGADMERCVNVAGTIRLPYDREIIHKIIQNFSIDDQPPIRDPRGLYASRLACELYVITAGINHAQNIYKCVSDAGYDVTETVFTGIANGYGLLTRNEMEEGAIILDIGASITESSVFTKGALSGLNIILKGAEDFKSGFVNPAFDEITSKAKAWIDEISAKLNKNVPVLLTGGLAFADDIIEALENRLSRPIKVGVAKDVVGEISSIDSLRCATAIGLVKYAAKKYAQKTVEKSNPVRRISDKVVDIFNNYF